MRAVCDLRRPAHARTRGEIADGIAIMLHALQASHAVVAIENNKPEAVEAMSDACRHDARIEVLSLPSRYPAGSAKQLIQLLTGLETPAGGRGTDTGLLVHNVGTAYAAHRALRHDRPLITRIVTVSGGAVPEPRNLEVPIGALAADLLAYCGGVSDERARLLMGGPMMGQPLPGPQVPVIKGTNGILALTPDEIGRRASHRRASAAAAAWRRVRWPAAAGIVKRARGEDWEGIQALGLNDCMSCGSCAYVCPSHIPLPQYFAYARDMLAAQRREEQKARRTRELMEQRQARFERQSGPRRKRRRNGGRQRNHEPRFWKRMKIKTLHCKARAEV